MSPKRQVRTQRPFLAPDPLVNVVARHGDTGPLVVLLPGLGADGEIFTLVADALQALGVSYIILEPHGFGYRNPADCSVSLAEAAGSVLASGELDERPRVYVGHSAGAMQALELASLDPKAVGLVMVNGLLDAISDILHTPLRSIWRHPVRSYNLAVLVTYLVWRYPEFMLKRLERPGHIMTRLFWPMVARPSKLSREALSALVRHNRCPGAWKHLLANRHYDLPRHVSRISVPMMVISGLHDPLCTSPHKSWFYSNCRSRCENPVALVELNSGHCSPVEAPEEVAQALSSFVKAVS